MTYHKNDRTFSCRYCKKPLKSDKVWFALRHLDTTLHSDNFYKQKQLLQMQHLHERIFKKQAEDTRLKHEFLHEL